MERLRVVACWRLRSDHNASKYNTICHDQNTLEQGKFETELGTTKMKTFCEIPYTDINPFFTTLIYWLHHARMPTPLGSIMPGSPWRGERLIATFG